MQGFADDIGIHQTQFHCRALPDQQPARLKDQGRVQDVIHKRTKNCKFWLAQAQTLDNNQGY